MTRNVGGALHNNAVFAVVMVNQQSEELGAKVSILQIHCANRGYLRR